jgi:hypothetical protein
MWRRSFFVWEAELVQQLLHLISSVTISAAEDRWVWIPGGEDVFMVKSLYVFWSEFC